MTYWRIKKDRFAFWATRVTNYTDVMQPFGYNPLNVVWLDEDEDNHMEEEY